MKLWGVVHENSWDPRLLLALSKPSILVQTLKSTWDSTGIEKRILSAHHGSTLVHWWLATLVHSGPWPRVLWGITALQLFSSFTVNYSRRCRSGLGHGVCRPRLTSSLPENSLQALVGQRHSSIQFPEDQVSQRNLVVSDLVPLSLAFFWMKVLKLLLFVSYSSRSAYLSLDEGTKTSSVRERLVPLSLAFFG